MKCSRCGSEEAEANSPWTVYKCGSKDYDQRPGTFKQSDDCKQRHEWMIRRLRDMACNHDQAVGHQAANLIDLQAASIDCLDQEVVRLREMVEFYKDRLADENGKQEAVIVHQDFSETRFDVTPAMQDELIRYALISMGWTPPKN